MLWEDMSLPAMKTGVFFAWVCALRLDKEHASSDSDPWCTVIGTKFFKKDPCWQWIVCTMKKGNDQYLWCWRKTFTPCAVKTIIFQRVNLNYIILCFTQCTLFFQYVCFLLLFFFAVRYLWDVCNEDKCSVVTHRQTFASLANWLV